MVHGNDPPPVPSTFKWTGCAVCTHTAQQPITGPLRSGPSGFGTLLHQWDERRGGEVCVLDTAYLGFDMYISEIEACLSNHLKSTDVIYYFRFKAWQRVKRGVIHYGGMIQMGHLQSKVGLMGYYRSGREEMQNETRGTDVSYCL